MINPLSAVMIVTGIRHVLSVAVSPHFSAANPEAGWPSEDFNGTPLIISGGLRLSKRAMTAPIPLPETYHVKNSDAILRLGFGAGTPIPIAIMFPLLLVSEHDVWEKIGRFGEDGEMEWETGYRQMYHRDLGDGIRIVIMNLVGHEVRWGELRSVLKGLQEFLVDGRRAREVMFRFRFGRGPEVGWGYIARGSHGGIIPRPPHGEE
ncbi:MAG: hypothetical protein LQ349_004441 [Xanthoria aureola]|nr:MAG: hypothetical protein LQ349_004441 [Xanthoria aureola]